MPTSFSVAMCTYNGAHFISEQLASIAAQTRLPDELVVCDDGSTDATAEITKEFARRAPFSVRLYVNDENLGSTKNFEKAAGLCQGELVAFADQDDVWLPKKIRRLEEALACDAVGAAFTDGEIVDEHLLPMGRRVWQAIRFGEREQRLFREGRAFDVLLDHNVVTGAAMAFRAEFKEVILPIPGGLVHNGVPVLHDWWVALLVAAAREIAFIPEPLFKYRQHPGQQMGIRVAHGDQAAAPVVGNRLLAKALRGNVFSQEIEYLRAIRHRLSSGSNRRARLGALTGLEARLAHLEARASLPAARLRRGPRVLRELLARRYHLYSNGLASAAKDLLL